MMMARKKSKVLSERQKRIMRVLEIFQEENGYPPSIRDICDRAEISSTSVVNYYLNRLEELGYIEREKQVSRGIRLLKTLTPAKSPATRAAGAARSAAASVGRIAEDVNRVIEDVLHIPVLGRIVAGSPIPVPQSDFAYFDADSMISVVSSTLPEGDHNNPLFALEVQGDSMIDAMVNDGDIVIMRQTQDARNGDMVAVLLTDENETTLKYFYMEKGRVRLQPANPDYEPIIVEDPSRLQIQGKVVMVMRQITGLAS